MPMSMGTILVHGYANFSMNPAVLGSGPTISFGELQARVHQVANALFDLGVRPGDRVAMWLDNCAEFLEVEQAEFLSGFVRTALSPRLHLDEVVNIVEDCTPRVVVVSDENAAALLDKLRPSGRPPTVVSVGPRHVAGAHAYQELIAAGSTEPPPTPLPTADDLAALLYTSGTTGRPKAAALRHRNWVAMITGLMAELPPIGEGDVVLHAGPMSHLSGSVGTACYGRGAATVMLRRFEPSVVLETVAKFGVTVLPLVPTMLASLTAEAERGAFDLSTLRAIPYGGSAVAPTLLQRAHRVFGDVLVQVYGLSEALVPLALLPPSAHRSSPGERAPRLLTSTGRATPFVDIRIVTDEGSLAEAGQRGEIEVRSETMMTGYWRKPSATAEVMTADGWLRTGDVGYREKDGYLYIVDRKSDLIVTGGFNVYPAEVEKVIEALPQVDEVVVVGAPHERWGETVTAVLTLKPGRSLTAEQVLEACRAHLASYKKPTSIQVVDALPKNSSGKLLRREVRDRFWADRERQIGE